MYEAHHGLGCQPHFFRGKTLNVWKFMRGYLIWQHPWFQESRKYKDGPKHDWYIWKDPRVNERNELQPPNNWESLFGGTLDYVSLSQPGF